MKSKDNKRPQFTIGVFAIIFDEKGRVLLCHRRDRDLWNLPGGGLEDREDVVVGVKRETKEETCLEVEVVRLAGVYCKADRNEIVFAFICKITGGQMTLTDEADRIEYFEVDELPQNTVPNQVERIKDAVLSPSDTVFKVQTGIPIKDLIAEKR